MKETWYAPVQITKRLSVMGPDNDGDFELTIADEHDIYAYINPVEAVELVRVLTRGRSCESISADAPAPQEPTQIKIGENQ